MTKLTGNKPSLKNPGESPRQEVLLPILSDLCVPFAADKNPNAPPQGNVSENILKEALVFFGRFLVNTQTKKRTNSKRRLPAVTLSRAKTSGKLQPQAKI